ncbi:PadR family transcriptional regulator [Salinibacterium sp. TMP30]|uniref:PadR family transcriptional regulator n=1 Tax=Salinibacterium sp. TMP30 TaxID=3138237 RepID=UPI003138DE23
MEPLSRVTAATLDVLGALTAAPQPLWGLRVVKSTRRPAGSVYPILERLERLGWVTSEWEDDPERTGPRRRLYELTSDGTAAASTLLTAQRSPTGNNSSAHAFSAVQAFEATA